MSSVAEGDRQSLCKSPQIWPRTVTTMAVGGRCISISVWVRRNGVAEPKGQQQRRKNLLVSRLPSQVGLTEPVEIRVSCRILQNARKVMFFK